MPSRVTQESYQSQPMKQNKIPSHTPNEESFNPPMLEKIVPCVLHALCAERPNGGIRRKLVEWAVEVYKGEKRYITAPCQGSSDAPEKS
jgi:hypothetical protein